MDRQPFTGPPACVRVVLERVSLLAEHPSKGLSVTVTNSATETPSSGVPEGFDPTDPDVCQQAIPLQELAALRATSPVFWVDQKPEAYAGFENSPGYFALTRHADVSAVSKNSKDWSSRENGAIIRFAADMTRDQVELQSVMIINQDPPDHTK